MISTIKNDNIQPAQYYHAAGLFKNLRHIWANNKQRKIDFDLTEIIKKYVW